MAIVRRVALEPDDIQPAGSMPQAAMLEIGQTNQMWKDAPFTSFTLQAFDKRGYQAGDTGHETLRDAEAQAEYQSGVGPDRWQTVQE